MSLKSLARWLPTPLYRIAHSAYQRLFSLPSTSIAIHNPGPLITETAQQLAQIPGWFNLDDLAHFTLVLETQSAAGMSGNILEIGCFHGRSSAVLATHLRPGEQLHLVDAFDLPLDDPYNDTATPDIVRKHLVTAVSGLNSEQLHIHRAYSHSVELPVDFTVRFAHVDGGHEAQTVLTDLALCTRHLLTGGILVIDDYAHPDHPGVTEAVDAFLTGNDDYQIIADLNRRQAIGRKLYVSRRARG